MGFDLFGRIGVRQFEGILPMGVAEKADASAEEFEGGLCFLGSAEVGPFLEVVQGDMGDEPALDRAEGGKFVESGEILIGEFVAGMPDAGPNRIVFTPGVV